MSDNFGWGELAKIERSDGELLRRSIEEYSRVNSESVKQYTRIVWASLISSLEVARYDCLPHRFSQTFQPPQFSVEIKIFNSSTSQKSIANINQVFSLI